MGPLGMTTRISRFVMFDTRLFPVAALWSVMLAACSNSTERESATVVRDSADVEILESTEGQWTPDEAWEIVPEATLEIGVVEGEPEYMFSNVEGALLLADGRIAVADRGSSQIRFYNRNGKYLGFVGGPGDGPGELGYIRGMGRCGADSLYVFEIDFLTVVYAADGTYVREARPYPFNSRERLPYAMRCAENGYYVAVGWEDLSGPPTIGFYRAMAPAWILAPAHSGASAGAEPIGQSGLVVAAELGTVLSSERIGRPTGSGPHPFGRAASFAIAPEAVYLGTGESFEVRRYTLEGRLERIIRWRGFDLTISQEDIDAYRENQLAVTPESRRPALERSLAEMPVPPAFPSFDRLEVDRDGNLWAEAFRRPIATDRSWTVLASDGALLGAVSVPPDLVITDIGGDYVLGIATDELGIERIRLHAIRKPRSK